MGIASAVGRTKEIESALRVGVSEKPRFAQQNPAITALHLVLGQHNGPSDRFKGIPF